MDEENISMSVATLRQNKREAKNEYSQRENRL